MLQTHYITVGDLKKRLENVSDDALVVIPCGDGYLPADVESSTVVVQDNGRKLVDADLFTKLLNDGTYFWPCVIID